MRFLAIFIISYLLSPVSGWSQQVEDDLRYLGQQPPGLQPEIFAPGLISKPEVSEFGSVFNRDGTAFFYGIDINGRTETWYSELSGEKWTAPKAILSHEKYGFNDPFLSPDENRLYFISERALNGLEAKQDHDIWYVERAGDTWSQPINAGPQINSSSNEYYMSFSASGTMYFSSNKPNAGEKQRSFDIYASQQVDGKFQKAVKLSDAINTAYYEADVFVDPEEEYLIFCARRPDGLGRGDLYISFNNHDGTWSKSINMGDQINSARHELCPFVSKDGQYLFYTSNQDIYWVSAKVIDALREQ